MVVLMLKSHSCKPMKLQYLPLITEDLDYFRFAHEYRPLWVNQRFELKRKSAKLSAYSELSTFYEG